MEIRPEVCVCGMHRKLGQTQADRLNTSFVSLVSKKDTIAMTSYREALGKSEKQVYLEGSRSKQKEIL